MKVKGKIEKTIQSLFSLWKTEEQEHILMPTNTEAQFKLSYRTLEVGTLALKSERWHFAYSDSFKSQSKIKPLENFPDLEKHYESDELFPFFVSRIPGTGQPKVQKALKSEHANEENEVLLLKNFGNKSIANPFELRVA